MARAPRDPKDTPHGILLVDKPEGPTSFDVIAKLRRALGTREIGHAGTLDPLATGLLVVLVGAYTRLQAYLTADDKEYVGTFAFGAQTTTDDREGEVMATGDASTLDEAKVRAALAHFTGPLAQIPPAYSAIQVGGERLYDKARRGETIELEPRHVVVHALELLEWRAATAVVRVRCSKGTYIRALARDLGTHLGVPAHLQALRRTASGAYHLDEGATLAAILEGDARASLRRGPGAVRGLPILDVTDEEARALRQGKTIDARPTLECNRTGLACKGEELVALVTTSNGALRTVRGFAAG
jgi:tRNA pseudouridine55 synthase